MNAVASYSFRNFLAGFAISERNPYGLAHVGVALSTSSVALVNFLILFIVMRYKIKRLNGRKITSSFLRILISSLLMSVCCWLAYVFLHSKLEAANLFYKILEAFLPIALGIMVFFFSAKILKVEEVEKIYNIFRRKISGN